MSTRRESKSPSCTLGALLSWTSTQGHILTGNGNLVRYSVPGQDFDEKDLPHYLIRKRVSKQTFNAWLAEGRRSFAVTGCWKRPIFSGGWQESGESDTEAFNLQTPSIFIDMRYPTLCPRKAIARKGSLAACSATELRILARQHCFSGYSYPEDTQNGEPPMFTRHHIVDWNYHARFPRNRPNRWWVELSPDGNSFKEFSFIRDSYGVPVYFERWSRYSDDSQGRKYLALRRITECPAKSVAEGRTPQRNAFLVIVGKHFALAEDRGVPVPSFEYYQGSAASPALLVDSALCPKSTNSERRKDAEQLLDLFGCYGTLFQENGDNDNNSHNRGDEGFYQGRGDMNWTIHRSTFPWKEGTSLIDRNSVRLHWKTDGAHDSHTIEKIHFNGFDWEVLESSLTNDELNAIFLQSKTMRSKL